VLLAIAVMTACKPEPKPTEPEVQPRLSVTLNTVALSTQQVTVQVVGGAVGELKATLPDYGVLSISLPLTNGKIVTGTYRPSRLFPTVYTGEGGFVYEDTGAGVVIITEAGQTYAKGRFEVFTTSLQSTDQVRLTDGTFEVRQ
jgi:hypothetical protein